MTMLDPCMGSGHFLVFALPIFVAFRMAEEKLGREAAVDAVLADNLFGLEIDPRCTQIAAFNLALAAWRRVGYRPLPRLNLGDPVVLQRADIEIGLEVLSEFQGAAQLMQFLKEVRGSKRLEICGETPPDGVGLDNVVDDVVQLFEPVLDDGRRQS
jgi:hypothetical protein